MGFDPSSSMDELVEAAEALDLSAELQPSDLARLANPALSLSTSHEGLASALEKGRAAGQAEEREKEGGRIADSFSDAGNSDFEAPADDWEHGGTLREARESDADSVSLSLPESFNDYGVDLPDSIYSAATEGDTQEVDATLHAFSDLGMAPRGLVAQMQRQIASLSHEMRSHEHKLGDERLSKASALGEAEARRQAGERLQGQTVSELQAARDRLQGQLRDHKQVPRRAAGDPCSVRVYVRRGGLPCGNEKGPCGP